MDSTGSETDLLVSSRATRDQRELDTRAGVF